jgi:predicted amidohydrolase
MQDLNISLLQYNSLWEDIPANLARLDQLFSDHNSGAQLYLLPEMFATGFSMQTNKTVNDKTDSIVDWMQQKAKQFTAAFAGTVAIQENGRFYNRLYVVDQSGVLFQYDKRHLFSLGGEDKAFTAGTTPGIFNFQGWKIHFQICYDLRFPVWARNTQDYDVLINLANWPNKRHYAWRQLLIARAIENQSYVLGINRSGSDGNGLSYAGGSMAIDSLGEVLWEADESEQFKQITFQKDALQSVRAALPFLADRDKFELL